MKTKQEQAIELLNAATSENGIVCFHAIDQPLVTSLCEIIGALHRELSAHLTADDDRDDHSVEIEAAVRKQLP